MSDLYWYFISSKGIQGEVWDNIMLILLNGGSISLSLSLKMRLAKCSPPIPSCMLLSPTMPRGSVHLSVNMGSLKCDLYTIEAVSVSSWELLAQFRSFPISINGERRFDLVKAIIDIKRNLAWLSEKESTPIFNCKMLLEDNDNNNKDIIWTLPGLKIKEKQSQMDNNA